MNRLVTEIEINGVKPVKHGNSYYMRIPAEYRETVDIKKVTGFKLMVIS